MKIIHVSMENVNRDFHFMEHYFQTGNRTTTMVPNMCVKKDVSIEISHHGTRFLNVRINGVKCIHHNAEQYEVYNG